MSASGKDALTDKRAADRARCSAAALISRGLQPGVNVTVAVWYKTPYNARE